MFLLHEEDGPLRHMPLHDAVEFGRWGFEGRHPRLYWLYKLLNRESYDNHPVRTLDVEANHRKYNDLLGYNINLPDSLKDTLEIYTSFEENHLDNKKTQRLGKQITDLRLNSVDHSSGLLLLPGQLLVWKSSEGRFLFASCTRSNAPYFTSDNLFMLQQLSFWRKRSEMSDIPAGGSCPYARHILSNLFKDVLSHWTYMTPNDWVIEPLLAFGAFVLSLIYAGCHATAWNSHFPTFAERTFWRGACIVIASWGPFGFLLIFSYRFVRVWRSLHLFLVLVFLIVFGSGTLLYVLARAFIVVEAFISVRSLPVGAYDSVDWLSFWPHM
jgi:hypothetical protein